MPITYATVLIGTFANAGIPPFAGFFSKDSIVEALAATHVPGHTFAYVLALAGVFVSALYSFRLLFYAFHGKERFESAGHHDDAHAAHGAAHAGSAVEEPGHEEMHGKPHESPWVVTLPLVLLAIPSVVIGGLTIGPMLYGDWFGTLDRAHRDHGRDGARVPRRWPMVIHSLASHPALAGPRRARHRVLPLHRAPRPARGRSRRRPASSPRSSSASTTSTISTTGSSRAARAAWARGSGLWGDKTVIDGIMVNGTARLIGWVASVARRMQTGFIYHYAFTMIFGVFALLSFFWVYLRKL